MNNFTYEMNGNTNNLVYTLDETQSMDSVTVGMLSNNDVEGFCKIYFQQIDETQKAFYNVTSKVTVNDYIKNEMTKSSITDLFIQILDAFSISQKYMLDTKSIVIDPEYMFIDVSSKKISLICKPIICDKNDDSDLNAFFKSMLFSAIFNQSENNSYVATLMNYLNTSSVVNIADFKTVLMEIRGEKYINNNNSAVEKKTEIKKEQRFERQEIQRTPVVQAPMTPVSSPAVSAPVKNTPGVPVSKNINGTVIPGKSTAIPAKNNVNTKNSGSDDEISWLYLMQHYNADNAAKYKKQKEKKKEKKKGADSVPVVPAAPVDTTSNRNVGRPSAPIAPQAPQAPKPPAIPSPVEPRNISQPSLAGPNSVQMPTVGFGDTTVLNDEDQGTTVLGPSSGVSQTYLIRKNNNERVVINTDNFKIGKEKSYVDYVITNNSAISRSHAKIVKKGDECFVVDTNSTNKTFVNGKMIPSNTEVKLSHGDKIMFANEEFVFYAY